MPSAVGIISIFFALISIGALILHFFVMKRRVVVDKCLSVLDNLLRARLELLYDTQSAEVREMCAGLAPLETRKLLKNISRLKIADTGEALRENIAEIESAAAAYNEAAAEYNAYIAKFPAKTMAIFLELQQEKEI